MNSHHEEQQPVDHIEKRKQEATACGAGCGCHGTKKSSGIRRMIGVIVLVAAGVLVARAVVKDAGAPPEKAEAGFAALPLVATSETTASIAARGWLLLVTAGTSHLLLNFTGSTTFTSPSGVRREVRAALPLQGVAGAAGLVVWILAGFI